MTLPILSLAISIFPITAFGQQNDAPDKGLFSTDEIIDLRLSGDVRKLLNDRTDHAKYHPFTLSHQVGGDEKSIPIKIKTRGHFRRVKGNCTYPPLLLNFPKTQTSSSLFNGQNKIKLVTPCRGEKYVVQEYLVYKVYNLLSPASFRARLVRIIFEDTVKAKTSDPVYGILLEDEEQMALRNGAISIEKKSLRPEQTSTPDFLRMAVFEFLIGNTDWSIQYLQNVKLIAKDSSMRPVVVPYDFDHAGIVRAPYAKPAEQLQLLSTQTRRYRGYCINDMTAFNEAFSLFAEAREKIYAVYTNCPLLDTQYMKSTVKFLDEFYEIINDSKECRTQFLYPCNPNGTGNVVIRGLSRD